MNDYFLKIISSYVLLDHYCRIVIYKEKHDFTS